MKKIALIGSGNIGSTLAFLLAIEKLGQVIMIDRDEELARGKALDINHSASLLYTNTKIEGGGDYSKISDSDVVVVTAGSPRKPGMSRDDLLNINASIISEVAQQIARYAPKAFVIVVTNPLDAMAFLMQKASQIPPNMVVGMAGTLDTARFNYLLAEELGVAITDIKSLVLGGHGDQMVPLLSHVTVGSIPISTLIKQGKIFQEALDKIIHKVRNGGAEIVSLLKTGSAFYAPAAAVLQLIKAYLADQKTILPCCAYIQGEYGVKSLYAGVPALIGSGGVERIIEVELTSEEKADFARSVSEVKNLTAKLSSYY